MALIFITSPFGKILCVHSFNCKRILLIKQAQGIIDSIYRILFSD
jgi:hypothetical protein